MPRAVAGTLLDTAPAVLEAALRAGGAGAAGGAGWSGGMSPQAAPGRSVHGPPPTARRRTPMRTFSAHTLGKTTQHLGFGCTAVWYLCSPTASCSAGLRCSPSCSACSAHFRGSRATVHEQVAYAPQHPGTCPAGRGIDKGFRGGDGSGRPPAVAVAAVGSPGGAHAVGSPGSAMAGSPVLAGGGMAASVAVLRSRTPSFTLSRSHTGKRMSALISGVQVGACGVGCTPWVILQVLTE